MGLTVIVKARNVQIFHSAGFIC